MAPLEWTGGGSGGGGAAGTFSYNFDDGSLSGWRTFTGTGNVGNGWVISPVYTGFMAGYTAYYKGTNSTNGIVSMSVAVADGGTRYTPNAYIVTTESYKITSSSVLT